MTTLRTPAVPETSIIIRALNEERHLPSLLKALAAQTYRDFEVVVVDSGSFDRTPDIAQQQADCLVRIKSENFTFGYSLNTGIQRSKGRFIAVVSAHTLPINDGWLWSLIGPLRNEKIAMVYGQQRGHIHSRFSESCDFQRTFGTKPIVLNPPNFFANNANSAVRRDLWKHHPFDETLPGLEDIEWAKFWMERGYQVVYEPLAGVYHIHTESWAQLRRRYHREGKAAKWIGIRRRRNLPVEVLRETRHFFGDMIVALRNRQLRERGIEIAHFRLEKLRGTFSGIWDGAMMENTMARAKFPLDKPYKAVVIHGPTRASLEDFELPPLKPGEVLVRVAYEGVCATDLEILEGKLGYYSKGLAKYPIVPGHEFSGTVAAVGTRVIEVHEGDRVFVECIQGCGECQACRRGNSIGCVDRCEVGVIGRNGGYAEYMVTPAQFVRPLPGTLSLKAACLCEPLAVVLKGLRRLRQVLSSTDRHSCAVVGSGPIGYFAAWVLSYRGHQVTVFDRNPRRLECYRETSICIGQDLNNLAQFDVIIEATGNPEALNAILHNSEAGSTILLLGLPYGRCEFNFEAIIGYDKTIVGSVGSSTEDIKEAIATLPQINTAGFMQKIMPLSEFAQAWELSRAQEFLKVILCVDISLISQTQEMNEAICSFPKLP